MPARNLKLGKYQHYKNNLYEVIGLGVHTETQEEVVIYKSLYDTEKFKSGSLWVRPMSMFFENINYNGNIIPRFKFLE